MPGRRGSETRQKKIAFPTRLTEAEHQLLEDIAKASGCTRAEALRRLIKLGHRKILPTKELMVEVGALGSNLNQIAARLNALVKALDQTTPTAQSRRLLAVEAIGYQLKLIRSGMLKLLLKMRS